MLDGVGSSEAYHIYISNRLGAVRPGTVGQIVPGYEARIVDVDGEDCADDEPGELWISGESTALMYWDDHEKSKRTFAGDLVRTGDLFARDDDGYFRYHGRADDLLKVGGIWVAPLEIENCLLGTLRSPSALSSDTRRTASCAHERMSSPQKAASRPTSSRTSFASSSARNYHRTSIRVRCVSSASWRKRRAESWTEGP